MGVLLGGKALFFFLTEPFIVESLQIYRKVAKVVWRLLAQLHLPLAVTLPQCICQTKELTVAYCC